VFLYNVQDGNQPKVIKDGAATGRSKKVAGCRFEQIVGLTGISIAVFLRNPVGLFPRCHTQKAMASFFFFQLSVAIT